MRLRTLAVSLLLVLPLLASAQTVRSEMLVSTEWLAAHLNDPKVVVLQVEGKPETYNKGHIPGARSLTMDLIAPMGVEPYHELPPAEQLKTNLEALGVSDDTRVIVYTGSWQPNASRGYFTLDYLGFDNVAVLDGGLMKWKADGRAISTDPTPPPAKPGKMTIHPRPEMVASIDQVRQVVDGKTKAVLIDARPMKRYTDGHIPGAYSMFWEETVTSKDVPTMRSPEELRALYAKAGANGEIISYCEIGFQASHAYFTAKYIGIKAQMFDGSWQQWSTTAGAPIVKGESAK